MISHAETSQDRNAIRSRDISLTFVKGMTILKAFDDTRVNLTLAKISEITNLDRASVRRLVLTLVHLGYVQKIGRTFSLTPRILVLAGGFLRGNQFGILVQPILNSYSDKLGSPISLAMGDGDDVVFVAQSTLRDSNISFGFTVGSRVPMLHTSLGRMLLAYGDEKWAKTLITNAPITAYTKQTILDREQIVKKVNEVERQGYAIVDGEFEADVTAFSVPIGRKGNIKAVIGTSEPSNMVRTEERQRHYLTLMRQCASALARTSLFDAE